jgi:hypothetical protein
MKGESQMMDLGGRNAFEILGISLDADDSQIYNAVISRKAENKNDPALLKQLDEIYQLLANPISRAKYKRSLQEGGSEQGQAAPFNGKTSDVPPEGKRPQTVMLDDEAAILGSIPTSAPAAKRPGGRQPTQVFDIDQMKQESAQQVSQTIRAGGKRGKTEVFDVNEARIDTARRLEEMGSEKGVQPPAGSGTRQGRKGTAIFEPGELQLGEDPAPSGNIGNIPGRGTEPVGAPEPEATPERKRETGPIAPASDIGEQVAAEPLVSGTAAELVAQAYSHSEDVETPEQEQEKVSAIGELEPGRDENNAGEHLVPEEIKRDAEDAHVAEPEVGKEEPASADNEEEQVQNAASDEASVAASQDGNEQPDHVMEGSGISQAPEGNDDQERSDDEVISLEVNFRGAVSFFKLKPGENRIGRPKEGKPLPDVSLPDPEKYISGNHATLIRTSGGLFIKDNESDNGTRLNGVRLQPFEQVPFKDGDVIVIEGRQLRLRKPDVTRIHDADDLAAPPGEQNDGSDQAG